MKTRIWIGRAGMAALAVGLAAVSSGFANVGGWGSFLGALVVGAGILFGGLYALRAEVVPRWVVWLTVGAAVLRLGAGALWFAVLPVSGYDTDVQRAGYVMDDAFRRDQSAWVLAHSDKSLSKAFTDYRNEDQYGGLLFLSAGLYRALGGETHRPLLIVVVTAAFSALAVAFTWAFARRMFDGTVAGWAAWGVALYPEAVLLGSSQMREAFMMTLAAAAFYGLARYWQERSWPGLAWVGGAFLLSLPLSPPLGGILVGMLAVVALALDEGRVIRNWRLWALLGGLAALVVGGMWLGWGQIAPRLSLERFSNPLEMVVFWARHSARWQAYLTRGDSGSVQKLFRNTPDWFNLPFLLGYGTIRPLLPAALTAWSTPIWRFIGVWRALGWTLVLPLLVYAPLRAVRTPEKRGLAVGLSLAVWAGILIAAFWGGGDLWDNPRYRVSFVALQMALAAWALVSYRRAPDPALRVALALVFGVLVWFTPWYFRRYSPFFKWWPVQDLLKLIGLGLVTGGGYALWDWAGRKE